MERIIEFGKFLTGHDTETVEQLYNDWLTPTAKTANSRQAEPLVMLQTAEIDQELLNEVMEQIENDWQTSGLSVGLYRDWAEKVCSCYIERKILGVKP